jgi:hypothetical protein
MNNHLIEGRLQDALAAHAQTFSASPDAWQRVQVKDARLSTQRRGRSAALRAGWPARHSRFVIPVAAAATVVAVALTATVLAHGFSGTAGHGAAAHSGGGSAASCVATLRFGEEMYVGTSLRTHPPYNRVGRIPPAHMHQIGTGVFPPCNDTNHSHDLPQTVQVARIDGVSPQIAVAVLPSGSVFVRSGAAIPRSLTSAPWIRWAESG